MSRDTIVFPTDLSDLSSSAVEWVRQMAQLYGAEVHCLYVVDEPEVYGLADLVPLDLPSAQELAQAAEERLVEYSQRYLQGLDPPVRTAVLVGRPADEIVSYAEAHQARMIVMSTHGRSGFRHLLLGSTTEAVLRNAPAPVLCIRSRGT